MLLCMNKLIIMAWRAQNAETLIQIQQQHDIYTTYKKPIDLHLAETHLKATSTGANLSSIVNETICACCGHHYNKRPLSICSDVDEFRYMGFAYTYMFKFAIFSIICLFIALLAIGVPLYLNLPNRYEHVYDRWTGEAVYISTRDNMVTVIGVVVAYMIILILMKWLFSRRVFIHLRKINDFLPKPQNFTAFVSGLQPDEYQHDIQNKFMFSDGRELKIIKINKIYDIHDYVRLIKKLVLEQQKLKEIESEFPKDSRQYELQYEAYSKVRIELLDLKGTIETSDELKKRYTGCAFFTFDTIEELERAINICKSANERLLPLKGIKVARAYGPSDVIWTNFHYSKQDRLLRRWLLVVIIGLIICLTVMIGRFIKGQEGHYIQHKSYQSILYYEILIGLWIFVMNIAITKTIKKLIKLERYRSYSQQDIQAKLKISVALWLNTSLAIIGLNYNNGVINYYTIDGVAQLLLIFVIIDIIGTALIKILNFKHWQLLLRRGRIRNDMKAQKDPNLFQYKAHQYFENTKFHLVHFNAKMLSTVSIILFFSVAVPEAIVVGIIQLMVQYYIWKFMFVHRSSMPRNYDLSFTYDYIKMFSIPIFTLGLGFFIYDWQVTSSVSAAGGLILALGTLQLLLPDEDAFVRMFKPAMESFNQSYTKAHLKFATDYDRLNPVSQHRAYNHWLKYLKVIDISDDQLPTDDLKYERYDREHVIKSLFDYGTVYKKAKFLTRAVCENPFSVLKSNEFDILSYFNFYKLEKNAEMEMQAYSSDFYHQMLETAGHISTVYAPLEGEEGNRLNTSPIRNVVLFNANVLSDITAINKELTFGKRRAKHDYDDRYDSREVKRTTREDQGQKPLDDLKVNLFRKFAKNSYFLNFDPATISKRDTDLTPQFKDQMNTLSMPQELDSRRKVPAEAILETSFHIEKKPLIHQTSAQIKPTTLIMTDHKTNEDEIRSLTGTPKLNTRKSIAPDRFISDLSFIIDTKK